MNWIIILLLLCPSLVYAQDGTSRGTDSVKIVPVKDVDTKPVYPGGEQARIDFVEKKIKLNVPADNGAPEGTYRVFISATVDTTGTLVDFEKESFQGYGMEEEVIRVLTKLPKKYTPAIKNGLPVPYRLKFPFTFSISN